MDLARTANARAVRHSVSIGDRTVVYFEYPSTREKSQSLVMIHGYRGNHRGLEAIAAGLSDYRVIIPDLPGFGESESLSSPHTIENYSTWLRDFLRVVGLVDKANLMGHSFGTLVAGFYAASNTVRSVSLVNPVSTPALKGPRAALTAVTKIYYFVASVSPRFLGQWLLRSKMSVMVMSVVMAKTRDKALRRWIHKQHLDNFSDFESVAVAVEGYNASISTDLSILAPKIIAPVLVVAAELDDITDIASQRLVSRTYPRATLKEINGVGHLVHYEAPDQASAFIHSFLEGL
jgi:pimeloyl-ACP methyl ester carboxylesterase